MSALHALSLDERLERFATGLPARAPSALPPLSIVFGKDSRWGIGLRSDAAMPVGGTIRLIHWIASPYGGTPDGIVEDCQSARLRLVSCAEGASLRFTPRGALAPLSPDRGGRRNLLFGAFLMGLRGWDIPHDRHMAVTDLARGAAEITGSGLPANWHGDWLLSVTNGAESLTLGREELPS